jgi:hypothetical protein
MENAMWAFMFLSVSLLCSTVVFNNVSRMRQVNSTSSWPTVEATVQSGNIKIVHHKRFNDIQLPVFELSYLVEQKAFSERFALSMTKEPLDSLIAKMIGRRITVQYDPQNPARCFIPGETIEGCRIEQKIGSLVRFYPRN